ELEDPLDAADEHPLEGELERDPELHGDVERVLVRRDRARVRPARNRLEHRTLELDEPSLVEHTPDRLEHGGAREERGTWLLVGDQMQVAASLLQIGVLQAGPLLRERAKGLRQHRPSRDEDAQLALARRADGA